MEQSEIDSLKAIVKANMFIVPPMAERLEVYNHLLSRGYSEDEAKDFDCLGPEYKIALASLKYTKMKSKAL